jgi:riboflavin synthase
MFTGLVEDVGAVVSVSAKGNGKSLTLRTAIPLADVTLGASIAVNGVCLTAEGFSGDTFTVTVGQETLSVTTIGKLRVGGRVNLEQSLRMGDRLGGHLVQGHVDGVGMVKTVRRLQESLVVWIDVPKSLRRYVAVKGSITVDGVSLTVNELSGGAFRINLIPHTVASTTLGDRRTGDSVNLEVDLLARYVERLLAEPGESLTFERLRALGYGD